MGELKEKRRKLQEERDAQREARRRDMEAKREERRKEREQRKETNREANRPEIDLDEVAEELKKFMCYMCKIFPRPGSYNRSELYRHYALVHFQQQLKKDYQEKYSFPCPCPFCPKDSARTIDNRDIANHIGQVHGKVEDYLPEEYHLSGSAKRKSTSISYSIKMEIEHNLVKSAKKEKEEDV